MSLSKQKGLGVARLGTDTLQQNQGLSSEVPVPLTIPDLSLWLDAADISSFTLNPSTNKISQWDDRSTNQHAAVQNSGANQPELLENGANGQPSVRFDGSNTNFLSIADDPSLRMGAGEFTIIYMVRNDGGSGRVFFKGRAGGSGPTFRRYNGLFSSATNIQFEMDNDVTSEAVNDTVVSGSLSLAVVQRDNTLNQLTLSVNGATPIVNSISASYGTIDEELPISMFVGSSNFGVTPMTGLINAILIYKRLLTSSEIENIQNYLTNRFNP